MPLAKPGGFRRLAGFHIGLYFWESACCGIPQSRRRPPGAPRPCQLPLTREPLGCSDEAPLAKGGCLGSAEAGGFHRVAVFHIGLYFQEVPTVNPSVKNQRFLPAPFSKGAFWRPVSFYCAIPIFTGFQSTAWEINTPKIHKPKRVQGLNPRTRAKAKGQSFDGSTRGILKGGTIRAGASCSPLEPASLHTFLPEQESMAPLASACRKPIGEQTQRL